MMGGSGKLGLMAALAAMTTGCLAPGPYHLRAELLYPPRAAEQPVRTEVGLGGAPACAALHGGSQLPAVGLDWSVAERQVQVTLAPAIRQFRDRMPVVLLNGFQDLHATLDQAVAEGCLAAAREQRFLRQVSESQALATNLVQAILLGPYTTQRFVDVAPPIELELTYARDPRQPGRYDLGYVDSIYRLAADLPDGRGHLAVVRRQLLHAPAGAQPPQPPLPLAAPRPPSYYRLFFYLRKSDSDHDVALLAAASQAALAAATQALLSKPDQCEALAVPEAQCMVAADNVGLEARIAVTVQGRKTTVALPATVAQAIAASGVAQPSTVLATLRVERPYRGSEAPVEVVGGRRQLLAMALAGGERIAW